MSAHIAHVADLTAYRQRRHPRPTPRRRQPVLPLDSSVGLDRIAELYQGTTSTRYRDGLADAAAAMFSENACIMAERPVKVYADAARRFLAGEATAQDVVDAALSRADDTE